MRIKLWLSGDRKSSGLEVGDPTQGEDHDGHIDGHGEPHASHPTSGPSPRLPHVSNRAAETVAPVATPLPGPVPRPGSGSGWFTTGSHTTLATSATVVWLPSHLITGARVMRRWHAVGSESPWFEYGSERESLRLAFCGVLTPSTQPVMTEELGYCPSCYEVFLSLAGGVVNIDGHDDARASCPGYRSVAP